MKTPFRVVVLALLGPSLAGAIETGEYVTREGWGRIVITRDAIDGPRFDLYSYGANGSSCSLDGIISNGAATMGEGESVCEVRLSAARRGLLVESDLTPSCRRFCGVRAGFNGEYLRVSHLCVRSAKNAVRAQFLDRYRKRQYVKAIAALRPLLLQCADTLRGSEAASTRNDLSVAYFHARDRSECLRILDPLIDRDADRKWDTEVYLPAELETWGAIRKAANFNALLCSSLS